MPRVTRHRRLSPAGAAIAAAGWLTAAVCFAQLPISGTEVPELAELDVAMTDFMDQHGIDAGLLAVMKDGVIVHHRGYGWQDRARTQPLPPTAMMRIASVTKPVTAAAIRELVALGAIRLDDPVFDLGQPGGGLLSIAPFPALGDARLADVTVQHCLDHEGGWDRGMAGDHTYREVQIANALGVPSPPGRWNTVAWILGRPLEHDPGTTYAYSNIGYLVLGLIVEEYSGTDYLSFVRDRVLDPIGARDCDLVLGRTFEADHDPREPWYQSNGSCTNVFDPSRSVNCPYGGWDHEARVSRGRIVSATVPLLHFLQARYISGVSIGLPRTGTEGPTWRRNHTGSLSGTNALARQRGDGVNYVVLFNERPGSGTSYASLARAMFDGIFDAGTLTWPAVAAETLVPPAGPVGNTLRVASAANRDPILSWAAVVDEVAHEVRRCVPAPGAGCEPVLARLLDVDVTTDREPRDPAEAMVWYRIVSVGACE